MPTTSNFGWTTPADTDLVKDGAAAIRTLGNGIDTSLVDLKGGTTGQVLSKASNTDLDFTWSSVDPLTILDAKGDLITATAADTPARLASSGNNGDLLTVDTSTATGLKWAAPAGSGGLTLLSTTTLSGASTTISSISGSYTDLYIVLNNPYASGAGYLRISPNGTDAISHYTAVVPAGSLGGTNIDSYQAVATTSTPATSLFLRIMQYSQTTYGKPFQFFGGTVSSTGSYMNMGGTIRTTSAITSMKFAVDGGYSWSGGQVLIYGVK